MKDFSNWGIRRRYSKEHNYNAFWLDLKTIRFGEGDINMLPPEYSEFYDVGLGTKCETSCYRIDKDGKEYLGKSACPFCYVSANPNGEYYEDICETWKKWMESDNFFEHTADSGIVTTNKPFCIAIGSSNEPTEHPQFCDFLRTVYFSKVVPSYTTNGAILSAYNKPESKYYQLSHDIIVATQRYVGGVAVSFGNKALRPFAEEAVNVLLEHGECKVNIHHIISTKSSVDEFISIQKKYGNKIDYHVLLPLMPNGRSKKGMEDGVFEYLEEMILKNKIKNVSFGAHFIEHLNKSKLKTWKYPAETLSKNIILTKDLIQITPSSFDMKPIKTIKLCGY